MDFVHYAVDATRPIELGPMVMIQVHLRSLDTTRWLTETPGKKLSVPASSKAVIAAPTREEGEAMLRLLAGPTSPELALETNWIRRNERIRTIFQQRSSDLRSFGQLLQFALRSPDRSGFGRELELWQSMIAAYLCVALGIDRAEADRRIEAAVAERES